MLRRKTLNLLSDMEHIYRIEKNIDMNQSELIEKLNLTGQTIKNN